MTMTANATASRGSYADWRISFGVYVLVALAACSSERRAPTAPVTERPPAWDLENPVRPLPKPPPWLRSRLCAPGVGDSGEGASRAMALLRQAPLG
jgi:hypothetical protein